MLACEKIEQRGRLEKVKPFDNILQAHHAREHYSVFPCPMTASMAQRSFHQLFLCGATIINCHITGSITASQYGPSSLSNLQYWQTAINITRKLTALTLKHYSPFSSISVKEYLPVPNGINFGDFTNCPSLLRNLSG